MQHEWLYSLIRTNTDECINWPWKRNRGGYGRFRKKGKDYTASREMCRIAHGEPPYNNSLATHTCNNRKCVNPQHLEWGTPKSNVRDSMKAGTYKAGIAKIKITKLTEDQVRMIKISKLGSRTLAREFKVSPRNIERIKKEEIWKWVK